eukprot:3405613-Pleurochrysis_carterae.AAC.1
MTVSDGSAWKSRYLRSGGCRRRVARERVATPHADSLLHARCHRKRFWPSHQISRRSLAFTTCL